MDKSELYLKTIFCCMACDGDIAAEEVELVRRLGAGNQLLRGIDVEQAINRWIDGINAEGATFLKRYLGELSAADLSQDEQLQVIDLAIMTIEADERIEYSEVKFFKKIRTRLAVSDEQILRRHPGKEDFLLPDISAVDDPVMDEVNFSKIKLQP